MKTVFDVDPNALIEKTAEALKKEGKIKAPEWAPYAKTGTHKKRPPVNNDWWYVRAAAVLRSVYISKRPIGVSKLRRKYGGKKRRGVKPKHFKKGSGSIMRKVLQQLQTNNYLELEVKSLNRGRKISGKGKKLLDSIAKEL